MPSWTNTVANVVMLVQLGIFGLRWLFLTNSEGTQGRLYRKNTFSGAFRRVLFSMKSCGLEQSCFFQAGHRLHACLPNLLLQTFCPTYRNRYASTPILLCSENTSLLDFSHTPTHPHTQSPVCSLSGFWDDGVVFVHPFVANSLLNKKVRLLVVLRIDSFTLCKIAGGKRGEQGESELLGRWY